MVIHSVYVTDPNTGEEIHYPSVKAAAKAIGTYERHVRMSCRNGYKCRGFYCRYGETVEGGGKRGKAEPNICFDCKKACGGCSWSAVDPITGKVKFEPAPGWTAEKVMLNSGWSNGKACFIETYHITACPLFEHDEPRKTNNCELTYMENRDFLANVEYLLKRWEDG